jgi:hypothetical protein
MRHPREPCGALLMAAPCTSACGSTTALEHDAARSRCDALGSAPLSHAARLHALERPYASEHVERVEHHMVRTATAFERWRSECGSPLFLTR